MVITSSHTSANIHSNKTFNSQLDMQVLLVDLSNNTIRQNTINGTVISE